MTTNTDDEYIDLLEGVYGEDDEVEDSFIALLEYDWWAQASDQPGGATGNS